MNSSFISSPLHITKISEFPLNDSSADLLIQDIAQLSAIPKKSPNVRTKLNENISRFCQFAFKFGLTQVQIINTLEIILGGNGIQSNSTGAGLTDSLTLKLIRHLYPRGINLPENIAIGIFGNLGQNRSCSISIQAHLLKWCIMVFSLFQDLLRIQQLYGVLFHYLGYETLRPHVCHLLFLLTRREHVKPFRIQKLMSMQKAVGSEPCILGLLRIYKDYYPNIVVTDIPNTKSTLFKFPDGKWLQQLTIIRESNNLNTQSLNFTTHSIRGIHGSIKRRKINQIDLPPVKTILSDEKSITVEEITDITELANRMDRLQMPSQLSSLLNHRYLQHIIVCHPHAITNARLGNWLASCLLDEVSWNDHSENSKSRIDDLLEKVIELAYLTKQLLPIIEVFLSDYLQTWNGYDHKEKIFNLLPFLNPIAWEDLYVRIIKPLYYLFITNSSQWKVNLINSYRLLLRTWSVKNIGVEKVNNGIDFTLVYQELIHHVDFLTTFAMESNNNELLENAGLSFFETVSNLWSFCKIHVIIIPSAVFTYRMFFTPSPSQFSRLCGIIVNYKKAFEEYEHQPESQDNDLLGMKRRLYVEYFNSFVMDMCNCIWRNRGLNNQDDNSNGCQIDNEAMIKIKLFCENSQMSMGQIFSLTHMCTTSNLVDRYNKKIIRQLSKTEKDKIIKTVLQNSNRPVTTLSFREYFQHDISDTKILKEKIHDLYNTYRVDLLEFLKDHYHMHGLYDFLYMSMTSLILRRQELG